MAPQPSFTFQLSPLGPSLSPGHLFLSGPTNPAGVMQIPSTLPQKHCSKYYHLSQNGKSKASILSYEWHSEVFPNPSLYVWQIANMASICSALHFFVVPPIKSGDTVSTPRVWDTPVACFGQERGRGAVVLARPQA